MIRTRIRSDQEQDIDFVSESELNEFFGKVVITGTLGGGDDNEDPTQDTQVLETFSDFFPGQGLILAGDGNTVTTGTQFVSISGFYNEFIASSGTLQSQITQAGGVTSITTSGTTVSGAVTFNSIQGITLIPDAGTNTITFSGSGVTKIITVSGIEGDITFQGAGEVEIITEGSTIVISGTEHTINTDTVSDAIIGGENVTVISGTDTTTISALNTVSDAIIGLGEVVVTSGSNVITISGTTHTNNTDTVSDAIIGGVGITVTSGTSETTIDGHLRFTKDENDAIIGGENVTVVSGADTITISSVDTVSDAIVAGQGVIITSGTDTTTIDTFDESDVDAINTVTGTITLVGGVNADVVTAGQTITVNTFDDNDVDSINAVTGTVTLVGGVNASVTTVGQILTINTVDDNDVDSITASGTTVTGTVELFGDNDLTITPALVTGGGTFTFTADPNLVRQIELSNVSGTIIGSLPGIETPASTVQGGFTTIDESESSTTSTTLIEKLKLTADVGTVTTGTTDQYRLQWYYEWGHTGANSEFESQIQIDDIDIVSQHHWRPAATANDDFNPSAGFKDMTLSSGTHFVDIDFASTASNKTSRIRRARLSLSRLTLVPQSTTPPQLGT